MFAILKREFKSCFHTFIGFLFVAVNLFFISLYYTIYCLLNGYPYFAYVLSAVVFLFMLSIPILTMRVLAEERKNKTDQLMLTAPVSVFGVVVGKYLAMLSVFAIPNLIACLYPLFLLKFGSVPLGEAYLSILGFFLYGAACIAICVFVSALTESQVIAAVISFAFLFVGYMMTGLCSLISTTGNWLTTLLSAFDLYTPFMNLLNGCLDLTSIFYYLSVIALFLFLTTQVIQKRRYTTTVKNFTLGAYSMISILVVSAIVVVANFAIRELPATYTNFDITSQKLYSITDQTKEFLDQLNQDVTIYVLANQDNQDTTLEQTLKRYQEYSKHISVEYVDPQVNPRFYQQYTTDNIQSNSLIVVGEQRNMVVDYAEIYESEFDYSTYQTSVTGYDGEGRITSALAYIVSDDLPKAYILSGHGETTLPDSFLQAIAKENVEYTDLRLMDVEVVPEDAACVIINNPTSDLSTDDVDILQAYLEQGGKILANCGYIDGETPNLDELLASMGLRVEKGLVVEQDTSAYYRNPFYLLPNVYPSQLSSGIYNKYYILAPFAQGILTDETREDVTYESILKTSEKAYTKKDVNNSESYEKAENDVDGPFYIGVKAVKATDETEATLFLYGCSQLFTAEASALVSGANQLLFTNTLSQCVNHEVSIAIPVKSYDIGYLTIDQRFSIIVGTLLVIIIPVATLIIGFIVWFRRRRR